MLVYIYIRIFVYICVVYTHTKVPFSSLSIPLIPYRLISSSPPTVNYIPVVPSGGSILL